MNYYHELKIGNVRLDGNILLGPMAGFTDFSFRLLCHEMGSSMQVTELISAKAIIYKNKGTDELLQISPQERPAAVQLFGPDAQSMRDALLMIDDREFDVLDVNMGCPVPKVVKNGAGSALMKSPALIEKIVSSLHGKRPVTVKIRSGFDAEHINAPECARAAEAGGAAAVCVHARTREQYYSGKADWSVIRAVKEAIGIPVIGNGDVASGADAARMIDETGCDGIMIGRAAQGNPWIFREVKAYLEKGEAIPPSEPEEKLSLILRHMDLMAGEKGSERAVLEMRKHAACYFKGMPGAAKMRQQVNTVTDVDEFKHLCARMFDIARRD